MAWSTAATMRCGGRRPGWPSLALPERGREDARDMLGLSLRPVRDLVTAARAVRHDQRVGWRAADRREQAPLGHPHRDLVMLRLVPERTRHPAAARLDHFNREAGNQLQRRDHVGHGPERLLVTVAVQERLARAVLAEG